jgi:hypothetical protein
VKGEVTRNTPICPEPRLSQTESAGLSGTPQCHTPVRIYQNSVGPSVFRSKKNPDQIPRG